MTKSIDAVPDAQELYLAIKGQYIPARQGAFDVLLNEFLDTRRRMTLNSVTVISTSTASRFMQQSTDYLAPWLSSTMGKTPGLAKQDFEEISQTDEASSSKNAHSDRSDEH